MVSGPRHRIAIGTGVRAGAVAAAVAGTVVAVPLVTGMAWSWSMAIAGLLAGVVAAGGVAWQQRAAPQRAWRSELVGALLPPTMLFDAELRLLAANEPAQERFGAAAVRPGADVLAAVGSTQIATAVRRAAELQRPDSLDVEHAGRQLRASISRVGEDTLVVLADRTREHRVAELRRDFVVNASHELKTPVTSIQTLAEALAVTVRDDPARTASLVTRLEVEAERLARLLHDLLDLRRLEERGAQEQEAVDVVEVAQLAIADVVPRADERGVEVALDAPARAVVTAVRGDVEVVVTNLVGNALQYNRTGGSISVRIAQDDDEVVVVVADTGIGIPHGELPRVFERFYRVDTARSRETGGTGLGLSIVRHAVERHGGRIEVDSLLGEGTTFTVHLPRAHGLAPATPGS